MAEVEAPIEIGTIMATSNEILTMVSELGDKLSPILRPPGDGEGKYEDSESALHRRLLEIRNIVEDIAVRLQL